MPEATIETNEFGVTRIECGHFMLEDGYLYSKYEHGYIPIHMPADYLDDLYAVLHARHVAQHYDSEIIKRIEKAVEAVKDDLYGGEG